MPRIHDQILESVFYLYPTRKAAEQGERRGGCGFFVDCPAETTAQLHRYAVSNIHVVFGGCTFLRINTKDGVTEVFEIPQNEWRSHRDGDDVAVAPFRPPNEDEYEVQAISWKDFVGSTEAFDERMRELNVGVGDDVLMVGRFVSHEGRDKNTPLARFGNIAMMPGEKVLDGRGMLVEAFLAEMRSLPGFSGSPVFLYLGPGNFRADGRMMPFYTETIGLLGIDTGHKMAFSPVKEKGTNKEADVPWYVLQNTGVAIVAPVWKIEDVLNEEDFVAQRAEDEKKGSRSTAESKLPPMLPRSSSTNCPSLCSPKTTSSRRFRRRRGRWGRRSRLAHDPAEESVEHGRRCVPMVVAKRVLVKAGL